MPEEKTGRAIRLIGGAVIVLELLVQQSGFTVSSRFDPLAAALWMTVIGAGFLLVYTLIAGRLHIKQFDRAMWEPVLRVSVSNGVIAVAYVIAVAELGISVTAAIAAFGPLCVGFRGILGCLRGPRPVRAWAYEQIALRVAAFAGVLLVNQPWKWLDHFSVDMAIGLAGAVISAVCFWNYVVCVFGKMDDTKTKEGLAVANLLSIPVTLLTVWMAGWYMGGGIEVAFSLDVASILILAGAGILAVFLPSLLQAYATGKVTKRLTGVLYVLDTPLAALIGVVGVALGLLAVNHAPTDVWVGLGIGIVFASALRSTLKGDKPDIVQPGA